MIKKTFFPIANCIPRRKRNYSLAAKYIVFTPRQGGLRFYGNLLSLDKSFSAHFGIIPQFSLLVNTFFEIFSTFLKFIFSLK